MSYYASGSISKQWHAGWDYFTYNPLAEFDNTVEYAGLCVLKYKNSYDPASPANYRYTIVSGRPGTAFTHQSGNTEVSQDINDFMQSGNSRVHFKVYNYDGQVVREETSGGFDAGQIYVEDPSPGGYTDAYFGFATNLPIFSVDINNLENLNKYLIDGDDSGADNYPDLHPLSYNTTVWLDGNYPNIYFKTELSSEDAEPDTNELTCDIYATPVLQNIKTYSCTYSLNTMQYVQYSGYANPSQLPSTGGGTQPTPYLFYVNPVDNDDTDYDAQIIFYVKNDGTVDNVEIQGSANHTITISDQPTPTDTDYPDEKTNFNHDPSYNFNEGTGVNTLTTTYKLSVSQLRALGNFLWSNTFKDGILGLTNYPLENIVSLKCMPVILGGTDTAIKIGNVDTGISAVKCDYRVGAYQLYVGDCFISRPFDNFMDYTEVDLSIYLPFIGYKSLDASMVMGRKIELEYIYDCVLGNCMAVLYVYDDAGHKMMFDCYQGTCGIDIAITSTNRADIENGMVSSVLSGIGHLASAASGNIVGGVLGMAGDVFKGSTQGFHTQSTGVGNPSLMTKMDTKSFIIVKRPQIMNVDDQKYGHHVGYPCNLYKKLSTLQGFTQTKDFVCSLIADATSEEKREIETLLNSGIYIM